MTEQSSETQNISMPMAFAGIAIASVTLGAIGALAPIYALGLTGVGLVGLSSQLDDRFNLFSMLTKIAGQEKILSLGIGLAAMGVLFASIPCLLAGLPFIYARMAHPKFTQTVERMLNVLFELGGTLADTLDDKHPSSPAGQLLLAATQPTRALVQAQVAFREEPVRATQNMVAHASAGLSLYYLGPLVQAASASLGNAADAIVPFSGPVVQIGSLAAFTIFGYNAAHRIAALTMNKLDYWTRKLINRTLGREEATEDQTQENTNNKKPTLALELEQRLALPAPEEKTAASQASSKHHDDAAISTNNNGSNVAEEVKKAPTMTSGFHHHRTECGMSNTWMNNPVGAIMSLINPLSRNRNRPF